VTSYLAADPTCLRLSVSAAVWEAGPGSRLLLMRRSDNGHWGLPGGYVEIGELVTAAAAREVLEETGVRSEIGRLVGVYSDPARQVIAYPDGERVQAVNLCFEAQARGRGQATTPWETLEIGFFAPDALPEPFVPIHRIRLEDVLASEREARVR